jgi:signal recognition particle receptor subunit alpha
MKESLTKILTTNREIDIIKEAMQKRSTHKPYVMVFIGVNGVGKSTNLAKVAYLFKN